MADKEDKKKTEEVQASSSSDTIPEQNSSQQVMTPLKKLLQTTDVLLMLYPKNEDGYFLQNIVSHDEITVYDLVKEKNDKKNSLLILLDTGGGSVYSAVKIMDCLRSNYKKVSIAVPQEAKSSGTMMCFGTEELIMSSISELGPLDKPMAHPDNENTFISALDIVRSIDGMLDTAIIRQNELAGQIRMKFGIRVKSSLEISSDYISQLISPMLSKEDVKIYEQAKRLLAIAERYGSEFLNQYMFSRIKNDKLRERIINLVLRRFIWLYPDHAFAIRRNELRDLFFTVTDAETLDYWDELWKEFEQRLGIETKTIKFLDN